MRVISAIFAGFFWLLCWTVEAAPAGLQPSGVKIIGFPKEGRLEADGTGHYADLMHMILAEAGFSDKLLTIPVKRAMRMFGNGADVCLIPSAKFSIIMQGYAKSREELIQSRPIDYITGHLVTLPGTKPVSTAADLDGKIVGAWAGLNVSAMLPGDNFELLTTESEISTIRMLTSGRVSVIWGWIPDSYILFERLGLGEPVLSKEPLLASSAHIVCKRTELSERLMPAFNTVIDTMRLDGRMKTILGKHSRVIGVDVPMSVANPD